MKQPTTPPEKVEKQEQENLTPKKILEALGNVRMNYYRTLGQHTKTITEMMDIVDAMGNGILVFEKELISLTNKIEPLEKQLEEAKNKINKLENENTVLASANKRLFEKSNKKPAKKEK